ncbi:hypothetical protein F442_10573 [Phytophthora nicotianae P10297]|uniref:Uncharacterized protein n=2 Tax=Phytophthora nicotianae TaxID=4792 RepID=W2Z8J3_PHYNI|nr:hypothetical protein F444_10772 [Phytophthora nicotianae P1976]ETP42539.1 hypothetical protein F442_10573 [Phytophthora nicotianae P10297]
MEQHNLSKPADDGTYDLKQFPVLELDRHVDVL